MQFILDRLKKVRKNGRGYMACCPAHDDSSPSLAVWEKPGGKIAVHCYAGCSIHDVMGAIGLSAKDLYPDTDSADEWKAKQLQKKVDRENLVLRIYSRMSDPTPEDVARANLAVRRLREYERA